jgi:hypothetical protein
MAKGSTGDISFLKMKLLQYVIEEKYEKAEVIKKWIIELGGDPCLDKIKENFMAKKV